MHGGIVLTMVKDVVPILDGHIFSGDVESTTLPSVEITLEEVGDSVVGHVDGGVTQRFDEVLFIPRQTGSQTEATGAAPVTEPLEGLDESILDEGVVSLEVLRSDPINNSVSVVLLAIGKVPLIGHGNHALLTRSSHNLVLRLEVVDSESIVNELLLDQRFGFLDLLTGHSSYLEHSEVES